MIDPSGPWSLSLYVSSLLIETIFHRLSRRSFLLCLYHLQVQRGFRSVLVYLTALDTSSDFLAVGSSIGMLYLYCRRLAHMNKYSLEVRALFYCIVFALLSIEISEVVLPEKD